MGTKPRRIYKFEFDEVCLGLLALLFKWSTTPTTHCRGTLEDGRDTTASAATADVQELVECVREKINIWSIHSGHKHITTLPMENTRPEVLVPSDTWKTTWRPVVGKESG